MTREEYYRVDEQSQESVASLSAELREDCKKQTEDTRNDIARTLEGIDTIAENRYLTVYDLKPIADILHKVEDRLILLEKDADPNRMDSEEDFKGIDLPQGFKTSQAAMPNNKFIDYMAKALKRDLEQWFKMPVDEIELDEAEKDGSEPDDEDKKLLERLEKGEPIESTYDNPDY